MAYISYKRPPLGAGFEAIASVTSATASGLTIPTGACYAEIKVITEPIRYRIDGTSPSSQVGMSVAANGTIELISREQIRDFRAIAVNTAAGLEIIYYKLQ